MRDRLLELSSQSQRLRAHMLVLAEVANCAKKLLTSMMFTEVCYAAYVDFRIRIKSCLDALRRRLAAATYTALWLV